MPRDLPKQDLLGRPLAIPSDRPTSWRETRPKAARHAVFLSGEVGGLADAAPVRAGPGGVGLVTVGMAAGRWAGLLSAALPPHPARPQSRPPVGSPVTPSAGPVKSGDCPGLGVQAEVLEFEDAATPHRPVRLLFSWYSGCSRHL